MKQVTLRLKTEIIRWATFGDIELNEETPTVVLDEASAAALMAETDLLEIISDAVPTKRTKKAASDPVLADVSDTSLATDPVIATDESIPADAVIN